MRVGRFFFLFVSLLVSGRAAQAQFLAIGGGKLLPQNLIGERSNFGTAGAESASGGIFALDVGMRWFPFGSAGLHYSSSSTNLRIQRGDAFGSSAEVELSAHTFTFDTHVRTPSAFSFRLYGLAGAGVTRFGVNLKREVEVPFPGGAPDHITSFVFTYGGGVQRHLHQLVHLRLEVRDYVTPVSKQLFSPGGTWHRLAVIGGITIGL